jgi:hypothetical protein
MQQQEEMAVVTVVTQLLKMGTFPGLAPLLFRPNLTSAAFS